MIVSKIHVEELMALEKEETWGWWVWVTTLISPRRCSLSARALRSDSGHKKKIRNRHEMSVSKD